MGAWEQLQGAWTFSHVQEACGWLQTGKEKGSASHYQRMSHGESIENKL